MDLWVVKDTSRRFRMRDVSGPSAIRRRMLSISRPFEVVVLTNRRDSRFGPRSGRKGGAQGPARIHCCVTDTKETPWRSSTSIILHEVGETPGQAIDLVDHHHVDDALLDILKQSREGRAIHIPARVGRVVVVVGHEDPALGPLTL
jgi:hypothetical protein